MKMLLLAWILTIMAVALSYLLYDKLETALICWRADHTINLMLAPPAYHKAEKVGRES